jgi:non-specific serine/threonine protein kinase
MTPERWQQLKQIFQSALERNPAERSAFLAQACADDPALRNEVESLISSHDQAGDSIEVMAVEAATEMLANDRAIVGKQIGHYQVLSRIGRGGMGEVFLAEDTRLKRQVALKILPAEVAANKERIRRLMQEATAVSALNHPNILTIHDIGEDHDTNFITTEYVEGETLRELINSRPRDIREVLEISLQLASALAAAHSAGIIHRDIKPENVMIRRDGYVKVLDFGLAKLTEPKPIGEEGETLLVSHPGIIRGTVAYMSPEQARGLKVDGRTDIWSFGIVLYELLARRTPFTGKTATDVILSIIEKEPPALQFIAPDLPNELYFIVGKTLRKKLDERYQTIKDVLADLRRVKQRLEYEEIERTLSPEDSKARIERKQKETEVGAAVLSDSGPSMSTSTSENLPPNNLSTELSPLIGRETELEEIEGLLGQSDIRLLTITGVGGTGKTRLALAVAHASLAEFTDGVYFINLSAIERAELVVPIIAQTLGIGEESDKTLKERLREHLHERRMLIVLDNFEQITEAAPQIGELLSGSVNLKVLVTSRVRLQLRYEHEFTLQPLEVPFEGNLSLSELGEYPAIELFVERAQAVKPAFTLTEDNAQSIAKICRRLDGLPLAIELAAVRVKLLAPQAILTRLSNSLKLLTGGARDLPGRQQTMRAAIAWSYDLLDAEERKLLNRLAVFADGFTLDAAEVVAGTGEDLRVDLLDAVASLVDKSLLSQRGQPDGEPRFRMLVVVREFALEALEANGEANKIKRLHAGFYMLLAEAAEPELNGAKAAEWLETLEEEHDNLRSAIEWSLENQPETALRIVAALRNFWFIRGYLAEGSKWIKQALESSGEYADPKLRAKAYYGIGFLSIFQGNLEAAEPSCEESLRLAREIDDKSLICLSLWGLGFVKTQQEGELTRGKGLIEESLAIARELNDKQHISVRLNTLGEIARTQGDYEAAWKYYEEALNIARQESFRQYIAIQAGNLAAALCQLGDYPSALLYNLESLKVSEELGDKRIIGGGLHISGALAVAAGEMEKAARLLGAAQAIYDAAGYKSDKVDQEFIDRYIREARAAIGDQAFEAAFGEGESMRLKDACALARETS